MEQIFQVGDRVYDARRQEWGHIDAVGKSNYPIRVLFSNEYMRDYTDDGRSLISDRIPSLYHQEMTIVPKDSLQRVVQVRDHVNDNWERRVLIKSLPNGTALCWCDAETIKEAKDEAETTVWALWRELSAEPEKIKLTRAEISEKLGIDINQLEITD